MDIRGMHYDFKTKLNKVDSQQYRNFRIPEIDWVLNEACEIYIKSIAEPRVPNHLGFEVNQRAIDDIRTLVVTKDLTTTPQGRFEILELPEDYMFYVSSDAMISKENCNERRATVLIKQHDDEFQESPFDKSSFEWREVNGIFEGNSIHLYTEDEFSIDKVRISYIRKHAYMHNAQDYLPTGKYSLPSGILLEGSQDCELPPHTHREIVDIAVLIVTGNLQIPDYQIKLAKLNLNQIN